MPIGRGALGIVQKEDRARAASDGAMAASSMYRTRRLPRELATTATVASGLAFSHAAAGDSRPTRQRRSLNDRHSGRRHAPSLQFAASERLPGR